MLYVCGGVGGGEGCPSTSGWRPISIPTWGKGREKGSKPRGLLVPKTPPVCFCSRPSNTESLDLE